MDWVLCFGIALADMDTVLVDEFLCKGDRGVAFHCSERVRKICNTVKSRYNDTFGIQPNCRYIEMLLYRDIDFFNKTYYNSMLQTVIRACFDF